MRGRRQAAAAVGPVTGGLSAGAAACNGGQERFVQLSKTAGRFAFPAMILGSSCLALGPLMVRVADVGPLASGFWRLALAAPLRLLLAPMTGQARPAARRGGEEWGG